MGGRSMGTYGTPRDISPAEAILEEVARTAGHVEWLAGKIRFLESDSLVRSTKIQRIGASATPGDNATLAPEVSVWLKLYFNERKHLVDVCKAAQAMNAAPPVPVRDEIDEIRARREARRRKV